MTSLHCLQMSQRALNEDWFNKTHGTNLQPAQLRELLQIAIKDQLFQFDGNLYEQVDGVALGSPLVPLMANTFMSSIKAKLKANGTIPDFYKRYADDIFTIVSDIAAAETLHQALNNAHPSLSFTMEIEVEGKLPFLGMRIIREENTIHTEVYRKPTNKGLLLHYQSHTDERYKKSLLRTMLHRAHRPSSSMNAFTQECKKLERLFLDFKYPESLSKSIIKKCMDNLQEEPTASEKPQVKISDQPIL